MGRSKIEWCHHSIAPVNGCSPASPGCDHCFAARMKGTRHRLLKVRLGAPPRAPDTPVCDGKAGQLVTEGKTRDGGTRYIYNGRVALNHKTLAAALKIPRNGGRRQKRIIDPATGINRCDHGNWEAVGNRVFWNHMSGTFHPGLTFEEIAAQFWVMASRSDLRFMLLTKRPERALEFFAWVAASHRNPRGVLGGAFGNVMRAMPLTRAGVALDMAWPLPNVAIGVSAEDQQRWDERIPLLSQVPAAMKFASVEPMLSSIVADTDQLAQLDQVIIGAESGHGAREPEISWPQKLSAQVLDAQVREPDAESLFRPGGTTDRLVSGPALFFKQWPVCPECSGAGEYPINDQYNSIMACRACLRVPHKDFLMGAPTGQVAKLSKNCPEFFVSTKYGSRKWEQFPDGWGK